jgi:hypothetical protein
MPARHRVPEKSWPPSKGKFRLIYFGSVENFYGRMLCSLIERIETTDSLEIIVVGPNADGQSNSLIAREQMASVSASNHRKKLPSCWPVPTRCYQ